MGKLHCIIIDDEPLGRDVIESFVQEIPFLSLTESFGDSTEALLYLQNNTVESDFTSSIPLILGI